MKEKYKIVIKQISEQENFVLKDIISVATEHYVLLSMRDIYNIINTLVNENGFINIGNVYTKNLFIKENKAIYLGLNATITHIKSILTIRKI